ncbi:MAG: YigZ family protein [Cyclobacteriaceae bacterium]|nr:YigZ family protein [Cyclobacteriaceae bacterium]
MSVDTYFTLRSPSEGVYKEKGSRFLAFAFHVENEEQIKDQLTILRKKYYDARHHCYAWILGNFGERTRANDDGEPSHSAGDPFWAKFAPTN